MKNDYKIKLIRTENPITGLLLNRTLKAIGHSPLGPKGTSIQSTHWAITLKDKRTIHINKDHYLRFEFSSNLFEITADNLEENSDGNIKSDKLKNL